MLTRSTRIAAFNGVTFLALGLHLPYWPVWLSSRGLSAAEIGMVMALAAAARVVFTPQVAAWADTQGERRRPLITLTALTFAGFIFYIPVTGFWPIVVLTVVTSFLFGALIPITDVMALRVSQEDKADYGRMRLWGSVTFMFANMGCGWLLASGGLGAGEDLILFGIILFFAMSILGAYMLPVMRFQVGKEKTGRVQGMMDLVKDWRLIAFMITAAFMQSGHAVYYAFGTLNWLRLGFDEGLIGLLWAIGVMAEITLFSFSGFFIRRLGPYRLLMIAGACGVVRWTAMAFDPALEWVIVLQCLHAGTFGAAHLAAVHFVARHVPDHKAATAQSLYASIILGSFMGAMTLASGHLYEEFSSGSFLVMAGLGFMVLLFALILRRFRPAILQAHPQD